MDWGEVWGGDPAHPRSRLQTPGRAWKAEEAILGTAGWLGGSCMLGSGSQAHTGWLHADWGEQVGLDSWFFRATVGVAGGHSQLLQYLKWFNNMRGGNREFKIKGKPKRGEAAHTEPGEVFLMLGVLS